MKYLMLIKHAETSSPAAVPQALMDAMGEFVSKGFETLFKEKMGSREQALKANRNGRRIARSVTGRL